MNLWPRAMTLALACLLGAPAALLAQTYPARPVRLIVAFAPGGPTDVLARIVANGLGKPLGQQVIVDNRAGAGGMLGTREAARAAPDGYTLLFAGDAALSVQPQLAKNAGYDARKDFTPLRGVATQANVLVAHRAKGLTSVAAVIARARSQPRTISYGSAGAGSPSHLIGALFEAQAGIDLLHVPYKGAGPAMTDLIGGQIEMMFVGTPVALQNAGRRDLILLGTTGDARLPGLPDVPTFAEAGIKSLGAETTIWWGVAGPAGLPADVTTRLDGALRATLNDAETRKNLLSQGVDVLDLDGRSMAQWITRDIAKWGKVIRDKGISGE